MTGSVVLVLGIGLGANSLMFMILDRLVLRPLPFPDLNRLVIVWETDAGQGVTKGMVSPPDFLDWQSMARSFTGLTAMRRTPLTLRIQEGSLAPVQGARVTADFFPVLGARIALGRAFGAQDRGDLEGLAVLSHGLWQRLFGADPGIVGRTVEVDGRLLTVTGILHPGEEFPSGVEIWLPERLHSEPSQRGSRSLLVVGRLKPGVTAGKAMAEMDGIARQLQREAPATNARTGALVSLLREELVANFRPTVTLVFAALGLTLVIVCINVANMLLVRAAARRKEIALRVALGAGRGELMGQIVAEILLLALAGAGLGLGLAVAGRSILVASSVGALVRAETLVLDLRVILFAFAVALVVGFCMALAPVSHYLGLRLNPLVPESDETQGRGRSVRLLGLQRALVILQLAVSLPLLVGSVVLFQNLRQIYGLDLGFHPDGAYVWSVSFPRQGPDPVRRSQIVADALARVRLLPGVDAAGLISDLPFSGSRTSGGFVIASRAPASPADAPSSDLRVVAGSYFQTLGIPLLKGRLFSDSDGHFGSGVALINEALAQRYWPDENPLGQRILVGAPEERALFGGPIEREIVGVVGNVVHEGLGSERRPELYLPYGQNPTSAVTLAIRSRHGNPASLSSEVAAAFLGGRAEAVVSGFLPMRDMVSRSLGYPEIQTGVVALLGLVSLLLVGMSVFAVISYFLAQKRHSLAVRMALGAQRTDVIKLVAVQGAILCAGGIGAGAVASLALARVLAHQVHLLQPQALPAVLAASALLAILALLSTLLPVRQILRAEPSHLLRYE